MVDRYKKQRHMVSKYWSNEPFDTRIHSPIVLGVKQTRNGCDRVNNEPEMAELTVDQDKEQRHMVSKC
jgi:hypothetical protein